MIVVNVSGRLKFLEISVFFFQESEKIHVKFSFREFSQIFTTFMIFKTFSHFLRILLIISLELSNLYIIGLATHILQTNFV